MSADEAVITMVGETAYLSFSFTPVPVVSGEMLLEDGVTPMLLEDGITPMVLEA